MIYAIGDIHGQITMLRAMLDQLASTPLRTDDVIVFIGDYIDRGENSAAVIELLIELKDRRPSTIFLRGNHEQLMLDAQASDPPELGVFEAGFILSEEMQLWLANGGDDTLISYTDELSDEDFLHWWDFVPEKHWEFLRQTRLDWVSGKYEFVHAGILPPGAVWEGMDRLFDPRLWIREPFLSSTDNFNGRIVVFGHTPQNSGHPMLRKNKIGIDTGAVFGGPLTCVEIDPIIKPKRFPSPHIIQIPHMPAKQTGSEYDEYD